jgi:hypothetical protein
MSGEWHYMKGEAQIGPVSLEQLCRWFAERTLPLETLVWNSEFKTWVAANEISGFRKAAGAQVPSLSKQGSRPAMEDARRPDRLEGRPAGVGLLVAAAILSYISLFQPLAEAAEHRARITYSIKGIVLIPFAAIMGLIYTVMGRAATNIFGSRRKFKPAGTVAMVLLFGLGILLYVAFESKLREMGYRH